MATQTIEFRAAPGLTLTARLFTPGSDTVVQTASAVTEATNRKGTYAATFTDPGAAEFELIALSGITPVARWFCTLTLSTATFQAYEVRTAAVVGAVGSVTARVTANTDQWGGVAVTGMPLPTASYTTPPTVAQVVTGVYAALPADHTVSGSYGVRLILALNTNRTVQVTGSNHIAADVHAFQTDVITAAAMAASAVTEIQSGLATLNNQTTINNNVLSRLASSAYTAPDNSGIAAIKVVTDRVNTGLVQDGAVWQFTVNMLENGPAGAGGGSATLQNQELILDQLDLIQNKTDLITSSGAVTSLLAGAVLEPGTIQGFPTTLKIGDSYTAANGRAIDIPIVDTDGIPLDTAGSLDFSAATVTFTVSRAKETNASRIVNGTATVINPPGTGTANAPYVRVEISSSETAKGLLGYRYTATLKFTWSGTGTDVMSFESSSDIVFDN